MYIVQGCVHRKSLILPVLEVKAKVMCVHGKPRLNVEPCCNRYF